MSKQRVLICTLTGTERQQWPNPDLALALINYGKDPRYEVCFSMVRDRRNYDWARNTTIDLARRISAEWLVSYDNDVVPLFSPLDAIAIAGDRKVIGASYGIGSTGQGAGYFMYPPDINPGHPGFTQANVVAGGMLIIHRSIWERILPVGPWFRWVPDENETLAPGPSFLAEDAYFIRLVQKHGVPVWAYGMVGHYRTMDITAVIGTMAQLAGAER
jgi:hypothetical protein